MNKSTWFSWISSQVVQTRKQCGSIHPSLPVVHFDEHHGSQQQSVRGISSTHTQEWTISLSVLRISIVKFSSIDTSEKPSSTLDYSNLETYSSLWLDPSVTESKEYLKAKQRLRTSISSLKVFKTTEECEQYLPLVPAQDRIIFLVNNHLGQEVVQRIHPLRQIFAIYIYHDDQKPNGQWTKEYPKVISSSSSVWTKRIVHLDRRCQCSTRSSRCSNQIWTNKTQWESREWTGDHRCFSSWFYLSIEWSLHSSTSADGLSSGNERELVGSNDISSTLKNTIARIKVN